MVNVLTDSPLLYPGEISNLAANPGDGRGTISGGRSLVRTGRAAGRGRIISKRDSSAERNEAFSGRANTTLVVWKPFWVHVG